MYCKCTIAFNTKRKRVAVRYYTLAIVHWRLQWNYPIIHCIAATDYSKNELVTPILLLFTALCFCELIYLRTALFELSPPNEWFLLFNTDSLSRCGCHSVVATALSIINRERGLFYIINRGHAHSLLLVTRDYFCRIIFVYVHHFIRLNKYSLWVMKKWIFM